MTQRLQSIEHPHATQKVKEIYEIVQAKISMVPNLYRVLGASPKVLEGYFDFNMTLGQTSLSPQLREQLAIAIASTNNCQYCLSAHTLLGKMAGLGQEELINAQSAYSHDTSTQAALVFAREILEARGHVSDANLAAVKAAGFGDAQIVEIVAHVALNIFTNYANNVAKTIIDFPIAEFVLDK
jgi:uncharacterized peroxidase-related enzyme